MKYLKLLSFFVICISFCLKANDQLVLIEKAKINHTRSSFYNDQITKLILQIITQKTKYQSVFSNQFITKPKMNSLQIEVNQNKDLTTSDLKVFYTVLNDKGLSRETWSVNVPDRFLLLQLRLSITEALVGKKEALREQKNIFKENSDFEKIKKVSKDERENAEKKSFADKKIGKKENSDIEKGQGFRSSLDNEEDIEALEQEQKKNEIISHIDKNNNELLKTSKNLENLRSDISQNLKEINKNETLAAETKTKKNKLQSNENKKEEVASESQDSDVGSIESKSVFKNGEESNPFNKQTRQFIKNNEIDFSYLNMNVSSRYLLGTNNVFNFFGINYKYTTSLDYSNRNKLMALLSYKKFVNLNKGKVKLPDYKTLGLVYMNEPKFLPFDYSLGLIYENQFFINAAEYNEGFRLSNGQLLWLRGTLERVFNIGQLEIIPKILYGMTIYSKSDFFREGVLNLNGTRIGGEIQLSYKRARMGIHYSFDNFSSDSYENFSLKQKNFEITGTYLF